MVKYNEVVEFIQNNHRNPSRHRIKDHNMINWFQAHRKLMNADVLKEPRLSKLIELLDLCDEYKRDNQWK